jgi:hypothetical protein
MKAAYLPGARVRVRPYDARGTVVLDHGWSKTEPGDWSVQGVGPVEYDSNPDPAPVAVKVGDKRPAVVVMYDLGVRVALDGDTRQADVTVRHHDLSPTSYYLEVLNHPSPLSPEEAELLRVKWEEINAKRCP